MKHAMKIFPSKVVTVQNFFFRQNRKKLIINQTKLVRKKGEEFSIICITTLRDHAMLPYDATDTVDD